MLAWETDDERLLRSSTHRLLSAPTKTVAEAALVGANHFSWSATQRGRRGIPDKNRRASLPQCAATEIARRPRIATVIVLFPDSSFRYFRFAIADCRLKNLANYSTALNRKSAIGNWQCRGWPAGP